MTAEPLPRIRLAEPFEPLRDASDTILAKTGARPKVFLANLGTPADFTARATFAKNFFEAGGIEAVGNEGSNATGPSPPPSRPPAPTLACLCSSDKVYEQRSRRPRPRRSKRPARRTSILPAGPASARPRCAAAGVQSFIFDGLRRPGDT